ncbi:MAG: hypothetical protein KDD92_16440 [Caldilineaceae bacterium]|nr:hypothetical protein [Caldilineaceae bacterium]
MGRGEAPAMQQHLNTGSGIQGKMMADIESGDQQSTKDLTSILIGSIIRIESGAPQGGYLSLLKTVADEPRISMYADPDVLAFVATYAKNDRADGSGSWQILSADGAKQIGERLAFGDRIHLLNMGPTAGYLDSFEWVDRLEPFKEYPMQIGVFTSEARRGRSISGTWTVTGEEAGTFIAAGDRIELENGYPGAGKLYAYGDVTGHPLFTTRYEGFRRFVFTGPKPGAKIDDADQIASPNWTVTLADRSLHLYDIYHQISSPGGDPETARYDRGFFKIGFDDGPEMQIVALDLSSSDQGETLSGTVRFEGRGEEPLIAKHGNENVYDIYLQPKDIPIDESKKRNGQWQLGVRKHQRVTSLAVSISAQGELSGTIAYIGEEPVIIQGLRGVVTPNNLDLYRSGKRAPEWVTERIYRVELEIVETYKELFTAVAGMTDSDIDDVLSQSLNQPADTEVPDGESVTGASTLLDREFQVQQLLNLYTLSRQLSAFFRYTLIPLMEQSLEDHRANSAGTLAPIQLFRQCFQHVATDHAIIRQATIQRQWNAAEDGVNLSAAELLKTDKLAVKAVMPFRKLLANDADGGDAPAVITYQSENTYIHLTPYAKQFILIGVSYDRVPPAAVAFAHKTLLGKDFYAYEIMAIPHEAGHYIYQHGKRNGQGFPELSRQFQGNPYYHWCEEIFADVYGCVVAGPLAAISMQAMLMSIDRDRAWQDDEQHPTPVLRIYLFAEILRVLNELMPDRYAFKDGADKIDVTDQLDRDWTEILRVWRYDPMNNEREEDELSERPQRVFMHDGADLSLDTIVNVERVMQAIRPMIVTFAKWLLDTADFGDQEDEAQRSEERLSLKIPWTRLNRTTTAPYNDVMAAMTDRDFARKRAPGQLVRGPKNNAPSAAQSSADDRLRQYLQEWDDSGPHGWGGH